MNKYFPTQEIGSLAKPNWLVKPNANRPVDRTDLEDFAYWTRELGIDDNTASETDALLRRTNLGREEKQRLRELATIYAIRLQEHAGLDIVYTGEQFRSEMYDFAARRIAGMTPLGTVQSFDDNYYTKYEVGEEPALREGPYHTQEFQFARGHAVRAYEPKGLKVPITGPYTMADWSFDAHHLSKQIEAQTSIPDAKLAAKRFLAMDMARNVIRPNIVALLQSGADYIQIDEPAAGTHPQEVDIVADAFNAAIDGIEDMATYVLHVCFSKYERMFPAIERVRADQLAWEFANRDSTEPGEKRPGYEILREIAPTMFDVGLGVLNVHTDEVESPELVRDRIIHAARVLRDPGRIYVNPDCGLRSRTWGISYRKLRNTATGAEMAREDIERSL
jgi:5-methyltetrahydropteroyltriglutamate--homocysteine methyltransferase